MGALVLWGQVFWGNFEASVGGLKRGGCIGEVKRNPVGDKV